MHSSKVEICGVNTAKLPVLKGEEKRTLFEQIQAGDEEAREKYIFGNLRLVLSIIQRFNNRGENADDIFQVGCIGLIKAIDNFDTSQGVQFSTYAVPIDDIRGECVGRSIPMTRKQALHKALEALTDETAKAKIAAIIDDMPCTGWSEGTIFDTIDQFILDHGRVPTVTDFRKKGLPPHPVIKSRFHMTLREFLNKHYPKLCPSKIYFAETKEHWRDVFLADYHANRPCSAEAHNAKRTGGTPSWQTIAKMFGVTKWVDWLNFCEVVPYVHKQARNRNTVSTPPLKITSVLTFTGQDGLTIRVTKDENGAPVFMPSPH